MAISQFPITPYREFGLMPSDPVVFRLGSLFLSSNSYPLGMALSSGSEGRMSTPRTSLAIR